MDPSDKTSDSRERDEPESKPPPTLHIWSSHDECDEDKWMKQLSAYHIGKDRLDSDAFCELQPMITKL